METVSRSPNRRNPPGPRGSLISGSLQELRSDPLGLYTEARKEFGDIVRFRSIPTFYWYLLSNPEDVEYVLQKNQQNYVRDPYTRLAFAPLMGEGLFTSIGDFWRRQRRLAQPAFHRQRLAALGSTMTLAASSSVERWQGYAREGKPLDVSAEMMRLTLQIVGLALFGTDLSRAADAVRDALAVSLDYANYRLTHLLIPDWVPTPRHKRFRRAKETLDQVVDSIINERRRAGEDTGDLLSMLMMARDEDTGEGMTDEQLRDEVFTLLLAGHETGGTALSWVWYLLSLHAEAERKLHEELDTVLGERDPVLEDLQNLPYTKMVIDEAMRLYPPAWGMGRQAVAEDEIRGYYIPAKALVVFSQYTIQRDPRFWDNPLEFRPERFSPEAVSERPRYSYFPFGGGARVCIGNNFALMEMQLILATLARHYSLRLVPGQVVEATPLVTLRPRKGIMMEVVERAAVRSKAGEDEPGKIMASHGV